MSTSPALAAAGEALAVAMGHFSWAWRRNADGAFVYKDPAAVAQRERHTAYAAEVLRVGATPPAPYFVGTLHRIINDLSASASAAYAAAGPEPASRDECEEDGRASAYADAVHQLRHLAAMIAPDVLTVPGYRVIADEHDGPAIWLYRGDDDPRPQHVLSLRQLPTTQPGRPESLDHTPLWDHFAGGCVFGEPEED